MIEEYFVKELENLKQENQKLREEIHKKDNKFLMLEERPQVNLELIANETLFKKLDEKGIDLNKIVDEMGSKEIQELIKDLVLYKEMKNDDYVAIIRMNNRFYGLEKYYNEYKLEPDVYVDLDDAIYHDLVDKFYDKVQNEINRREKEKKEC